LATFASVNFMRLACVPGTGENIFVWGKV